MAKLFGFPIVEAEASIETPKEIFLADPFKSFVYGTLNGEPFKMLRSDYERVRREHPEFNLPEPPPVS